MSDKIRKSLAALLLCLGGFMLCPQQKPLAASASPAAHTVKEASTILPAPGTIHVAKTTYNSVTLNWGEVAGAMDYQVEYSIDGKDYTVAGRAKKNTRSFKCRELLTGTEYQFRVCAVDKNKKAGNYALVKAQPYLKKSKITNALVTQSHEVSLEWKKISGADKYQLYRKPLGNASYKLLATVTEPAYTDQSANMGETYVYSVRAVRNVNGKTVKAKLSAIAEVALTIPSSELTACIAVNYRSVKLSWQQSDSVTGYYIYRSIKENGSYKKIKTIKNNTTSTYTDTGIVPGKSFYYKICTYVQAKGHAVMTGGLSKPMSAQTQMDAPTLSAVNADKKNRSLTLSWAKSEHATGYRIYRSLYPNRKFSTIDNTDSSAASYEDRAVTPGGTYYYRIKAVYAYKSYKGLSLASSVLSGNVLPSSPIGLTVCQTATDTLEINWEESHGATSYNLYRAQASGSSNYTCIAKGLTMTQYIDSGLGDNKTYFYKVTAVGEAGEGNQSLPASYTVGGIAISSRTLKVCVGVSKKLEILTFLQGKVTWKSDKPEIATVDSNGTVKGISYGTATVTATVSGKSAKASVSVTPGKKNGIDVSRWQEEVDWIRVKNSGIEFAFIRISNHYLEDYTFETKYRDASLAGIPLGAYCYSRAVTAEEAAAEARTVLTILDGRKLDYPIALDLEDTVHKSMEKEKLHELMHAFRQVIEDAGYQFVLYSYVSFLNTNMDNTKLDGIDLWIARYRNVSLGTGYNGTGNEKYWQYNSGQYKGSDYRVDGITDAAGNLVAVDMNIEF